MSATEQVRTLLEKVEKAGVCMLTTSEPEGRIVSRPMVIQEVEDDRSIWFLTRVTTSKVDEAIGGQPVNVTVAEKGFWASVSGTASIVRDTERKKRYWSKATEAFFADADPEDAGIVLLKITPDTGEYWDSPGLPATVVEIVKGMISDEPARPGESTTVEL